MHDTPFRQRLSDSDSLYASLYSYLSSLTSSYILQQFLPLLVLIGAPLFVLLFRHYCHQLLFIVRMGLEGLGLGFLWNWGSGESSQSGQNDHGNHGAGSKDRRKKKAARTKKEQGLNGNSIHGDEDEDEDDYDVYYPGLVNVSGTYCFLNSVLQAMASLAYLEPHLDAIQAKAIELDVPTPVVDTLKETLQILNSPRSSPYAYRPMPIINALSQPAPGTGKRSLLFSSRQHQDAQELFQLLSECIKQEAHAVDAEGARDRGLGSFARELSSGYESGFNSIDIETEVASTGVFDGLTANRRSCVTCGYTEAVMHFALDSWQLSLPRTTGVCALSECLEDYTRLEILTDCICRRCSMNATYKRLHEETERLEASAKKDGSSLSASKKKRLREARKLEARVKSAIDEWRIEDNVKDVTMERVFSKVSTKQAMIARPPKDLVLHLNRSIHYGGHAGKNPCKVIFPEILDITPYTTSGQLSTQPQAPISTPPPPFRRSTTPTQALFETPRVLYRLAAVVCHYGGHSFGHYVCFRRKPRFKPQHQQDSSSPGLGKATLNPPTMACPYGCECVACRTQGPVRDSHQYSPNTGRGWLRISDDNVEECGIERVLAEGGSAFLLFYERAVFPRPTIYMSNGSPRSSEETVRPALYVGADGEVDEVMEPETKNGNAHFDSEMVDGKVGESTIVGVGMLGSVDNVVGSSSSSSSILGERMHLRPRVVRRTTAGRARSASVATVTPSTVHASTNGTSMVSSAPTLGLAMPTESASNQKKMNGSASLLEEKNKINLLASESTFQKQPNSPSSSGLGNGHPISTMMSEDSAAAATDLASQHILNQKSAALPESPKSKAINGHAELPHPSPVSPATKSALQTPASSSPVLMNGHASPSRSSHNHPHSHSHSHNHTHNHLATSPTSPKSSPNEYVPDRASVNLKA